MLNVSKQAFGAFVGSVLLMAAGAASAAQGEPPKDVGASYKMAAEWAHPLPNDRQWGSTSAVNVDPDGVHIWALDRCGGNTCTNSTLNPVMEIDPTGKVVKQFGAGLMIIPHGITVDKDGNVWVTDYGSDEAAKKGLQVFKFSPEGKILMTLGKAGVSGDGPDTFIAPSDVLVAPNGNIFVSDGHAFVKTLKARIVVFSPQGKFIRQFAEYGTGQGQIMDPHALAMDSKGRLFVGDRENNRIQIFSQDGKSLAMWKQFGRPCGMAIDKSDTLYSVDCESQGTDQAGRGYNPGFKHMVSIGSAATGQVTGTLVNPPFNDAEGIAVDAAGNIYGAEVRSKTGGVHKYLKQ